MPLPPCPHCGTLPEADSRFCGGCGQRLPPPPPITRPRDPNFPPPRPAPIAPAMAPLPAPLAGPATLADVVPTVPTESALDKLVGRTLNNRYLVQEKIGEGGFGAVFAGKQVATGREVALKVLHPHNVSDSTVVARFRREAEACSRLRNAHTVTIYDFDETGDGILYLVMELVRGRSLQEVQKTEGPLSPARALGILHQIADALAEAHDQGLVHRDMKPENVMIESRDGEDFVKVLDFGIAKIVSGDAAKKGPALTAFGQTVGTLEFMSPEQLRGHDLDGRSDVYAVGIMAYEMLTGELPFGEVKVATDIIHFHMQVPAPPPSRIRPGLGIPSAVDAVVLKMVAKSPSDRHADATALRQNVAEALASLESSAARREMLRMSAVIGALALLITGLVILFTR
jgi:serine/threonine protein kinase